MASRRKLNGSASLKRVLDAVQMAGCELHDFFVHAPHAVNVEGFDAQREAYRFRRFRDEGVVEHPNYAIPHCIMALADMVHSAPCPRKFFIDLRSQVKARFTEEAPEAQAA